MRSVRQHRSRMMINTMIDLEEIRYEYENPGDLLESIAARGIAIPVQVACDEQGYYCVDGRKRLSACRILSQKQPKFTRIPVMIVNDYSKAGSAFWGNTRNRH